MGVKLMKLKKFSRTATGRLVLFGAVLALVAANFGPILKVRAQEPENSGNYAQIILNGVSALENKNNTTSITATYEHGTLLATGSGLYSDGNSIIYVPAGNNITLNVNEEENYTGRLTVGGANVDGLTYTSENLVGNGVVNVDVEFNTNNNPQPDDNNPPAPNKSAPVNVSVGDGTYTINGENRNYAIDRPDDINIGINGSMWNPSPESIPATIDYYSDDGDNTVTFTFETLWPNRYYEDIVINNHTYNLAELGVNYDDRTWYLTHCHGTPIISFEIPNVPKADSYDIVVKHGESETKYLSIFLWTGDPTQAGGHDYIGNSRLEFVKATYSVDNQEYTVTENDIEGHTQREGEHNVFHSVDGFMTYGVKTDVEFDDGSLTLPGEAEVTMRVVPEYGYQVTSVNGGENFVTTDEGVSEFTLVVHNGEAGYFQATVEQVDNTVTPVSEKVKAGEITLGENAATDIASGTVVLSVEDVELSSDKITNFEEQAAGAGDYTISSYLDINLSKVLYRGTADNVWDEQIHHLTDKALISLQLEEGVDGNNIVIVHNIDDGDEFEIIPIESYDPETNIITFYTDSFSNFAIASKTVDTPDTGAFTQIEPGAAISMYGMIAMFVLIATMAILCYNRRHDSE